eukprot:5435549-Pyramimonas_sp.AAC.1
MPIEGGFSNVVGSSNTKVAGLAQGPEARAIGVINPGLPVSYRRFSTSHNGTVGVSLATKVA